MEDTREHPDSPRPPVTVVRPARNASFVAEVRGHRIETDQPWDAGGEDSAPTPLELLGAALGSCIALYVSRFCQVRGIGLEHLRIEVRSAQATRPTRLGQLDVAVTLPEALPEHYRQAILHVARTCPVHNTLGQPPAMEVSVRVGDSASA